MAKTQLPHRERLERIAEVLGLPLGELLALSGWAGAGAHFTNGDAHQDHDRRPDNQVDTPGTNAKTVSTVRRAFATWRGRSDRSAHDRETIDDIERQFMRLMDDERHPSPGADDD